MPIAMWQEPANVLEIVPNGGGGLNLLLRPVKSLNVNFKGLFVGEVLDSSIPTGDVVLDPYARFDLAMTWNAHKNLSAFVAVENLFNEDYEQFVGFPEPGISPRGGIKIYF